MLALMCAALGMPVVAHADGDPDSVAIDTARADFSDGTSQYRAKKWGDALKSFERSYQVVPSPNALLMIARCQRELGRASDAASTFASAEYEAKKRVKNGESKYADTAQAATTEGNAVRKDLGELRIHVARPGGLSLYVDKKAVTMTSDGEARAWHEPGSATVLVVDEKGNEARQEATLSAGAVSEVSIAAPDGTARPTPNPGPIGPPKHDVKKDEETKTWPGWFLPATIAAGGTTLAAGGLAVGFGLSSQSTYKGLYSTCGPNKCGAAQRDAADSGSRAQTIANVSYVVAAVGLVATAVIVYFGLKSGGVISGPL